MVKVDEVDDDADADADAATDCSAALATFAPTANGPLCSAFSTPRPIPTATPTTSKTSRARRSIRFFVAHPLTAASRGFSEPCWSWWREGAGDGRYHESMAGSTGEWYCWYWCPGRSAMGCCELDRGSSDDCAR